MIRIIYTSLEQHRYRKAAYRWLQQHPRLGTPGMAGMSTPVGLTPNFASMTPEQIQVAWEGRWVPG